MNAPDDDLLWLYLDGELGAREHALVEKTLAQDPAWQERFAVLQAEDEVLRSGILEAGLDAMADRMANKVLKELSTKTDTPHDSDSEHPDQDPV